MNVEASQLDEVEVLESPDGDPRKRGEIRVAHTIRSGEDGYVEGPIHVSDPLSDVDDPGELLTPGMLLQGHRNADVLRGSGLGAAGSLLYPSEAEVRRAVDAVHDSENGRTP